MLVIQILILLFCLFALVAVVRRHRAGRMPRTAAVLWGIFWIAVGVLALLPETTTALARALGVGRGVDVVIYLALLLTFYLLFRLFTRIEEVEGEITRLVRELALERLPREGGGPPDEG